MRWFIAVVFAVLIGTILPDGARAQCSAGLITNCPPATNLQPDDVLLGWQSGQNPHTRKFPVGNIVINSSVPWIQATAYGVKADGVTSNDQALGLALYACSQAGTQLLLPPGKILLTGAAVTGNATRVLQNCALVGSDIPAGSTTTASLGSVIEPTSTSVSPFILGSDISVKGVNFYYPGQITGTTHYPALFTDAGPGSSVAHAVFTDTTIVNAYDGFVQTSGSNWSDFKFTNSTMYAVDRLFKVGTTGDSWAFSNMRFTFGPWINVCGAGAACNATVNSAIYAADLVNAIFEVIAGSGMTFVMATTVDFGWRYGILVDSGGVLGASTIDVAWDGTGTIVDSSAGQFLANTMRGSNAPCFVSQASGNFGNWPCFNMGANSQLLLNNYGGGSRGDFIDTAGSNVTVLGGSFGPLAQNNDGTDYYFIKNTGAAANITLTGTQIVGNASTTNNQNLHTHAVLSTVAPSSLTVQNDQFLFFDDIITTHTTSNPLFITGNWSLNSAGTADLVFTGTDAMTYANNSWSKPPVSTVTGCGTCTVQGDFSGNVFMGTGTTGFVLTLPFAIGGTCLFSPSISAIISGGPSGNVWNVGASASLAGAQVHYRCGQ